MFNISRRQALAASGGLIGSLLVPQRFATAAVGSTLTIAYNVNLPSFDPTTGPSAVNPTIQSIYQSIFDHYIGQKPDLSFKPGLLTKWGWNDDKTKVVDGRARRRHLARRHAVHAGRRRLVARARRRSRTAATRSSSSGPRSATSRSTATSITADVMQFEPTLFKWMAFLTGYVLPKAYYEKVGAEGFEKKPIGTGPYMVDEFRRQRLLCGSRPIRTIGAASRPSRP